MNEMDSAGAGIVGMSYNWLSYRVIHDGIASYAHFHDAFLKKLQLYSAIKEQEFHAQNGVVRTLAISYKVQMTI